jgi:hypothetical protein
MHKAGTILEESYVDDGTRLVAYVPRPLAVRLQKAALRGAEQPEGAAIGGLYG